jgi:hypothetical protein
MTTHNDWRPRYTARLHELWRQEREVGSRPEAADLEAASQQDFIALAQRSKDRRDDALKQQIDKLLDKARILTGERRAEVERAARRLAAKHTAPDRVHVWLTEFFHPDSDEARENREVSAVLAAHLRRERKRDKLARALADLQWTLTAQGMTWQATHPEHGATSIYVDWRDLLREIDRKTPPLPMENARSARPPAPEAVFADE